KVSHLRNRECLFLVGPNATRLLRDPNWGEQLSLKLAK
ncbi:MAG: hypothetical protein JWN48_3279, partial [Myxococcaceae bacterium]|nr:hypothetical protein [Myxococcaceae bacterium]